MHNHRIQGQIPAMNIIRMAWDSIQPCGVKGLFSGSFRPPVERGKKHLFSHIRYFMNPFFSRWKVDEVTFCKSMEVTDLGRERIDVCRKCPFYSLGFCVMCGKTMVLHVSTEDMECPQGKWDSNASSEWCSGHI